MAVIKLIGPGTTAEGRFAIFAVGLDGALGNILAAGASIDITLDSANGTGIEGTDFARLVAADLLATDSSKIQLSNFSTNSTTGRVSLRVTNISTSPCHQVRHCCRLRWRHGKVRLQALITQ